VRGRELRKQFTLPQTGATPAVLPRDQGMSVARADGANQGFGYLSTSRRQCRIPNMSAMLSK
jgi:hypothetical protein